MAVLLEQRACRAATGSYSGGGCRGLLPLNRDRRRRYAGATESSQKDAFRSQSQRGMAVRNAEISPEKRIEFRMGINIGDVIEDDGDVFGDGVNVAVRLEGISARGGICISRQVLDLIEGKVDIACRELGRQNLKNIARPIEVYGIDLAGEGSLAARLLANSDLK